MDFMDGFFQQNMERERLARLQQKLKPAFIRGAKKCVQCGYCCHQRSCIPTPKELKDISKFLKLTPKRTIEKFFAIDRKNFDSTYYVKAVCLNTKDLGGNFIPSDRTFNEGKCIFLDSKNNCRIYKVRPNSARVLKCWEEKQIEYSPIKEWEGNQLKKQFGFNGEKLEEEE